jgi:hypothetical protein
MPSKTDFNVSPYYDDYDEAKKFHRVMYRPSYAVQARELTTQQSITQNQIEKMGDHLFKHGAMVIPGEVSLDIAYQAVKLTSFTGTLNNFQFTTVTGGTSGLSAEVINLVATDGTDPDTLFVKYKNSGTDNATSAFVNGETLTSDSDGGETAVVSATAVGSAAHIAAGTYYINGFFVNVDPQVLILDKYLFQPSYRIGLTIVETFITSTDDTSLLDNATGTSNANATGAHRFKIELALTKLSLNSTADAGFVELIRVENGAIKYKVQNTEYNHLENTLARRTFDESGDYAVEPFDIDIRESINDGTNNGIYTSGDMTNEGKNAFEDLLAVGMGQGIAYVKGFETRKIGTTFIDLFKARDYLTSSGSTIRFSQLPFINITNLYGTPDVGFVSGETEVYKKVRLVDTEHGTRGTEQVNATGTVYDIGRAKTRGIEYSAGTASTVFMSTSSVTTNTYKYYPFDVVMFAHINCVGAMSGALTAGDILTGGTSGATGIVESITTNASATITGATSANPVVVTCSGGHKFKEGQQVTISGVSGITDINATWTAKDPTATTFKLYQAATTAIGDADGSTQPATVDGSGYSSFSGSGGVAKHDVIVLSDVKGEFTDGETITAPTNSRTGTVQYGALRAKGFEQKDLTQTKGISMAGSPTFTSDVDLTSTYGSHKTLTGTITVAGSATAVYGFGTRFTSELKIGDEITWTTDGNATVTKIVESISSDTLLEIAASSAVSTKVSFIRKRTKLQSANNDRALFKMPYDVVKTLLTTDNSGVSDTSFKIRRQFVQTLSSSGTATLTAGTNEVFSAHSEADFTVSVMTTGAGGTGAVGDVVTLATAGDFTLGGSPSGKTLAIDLGSGWNGHKVKILATISTSVAGAKTKTATTNQTLTVDTAALSGLTQISLGYADVYQVQSVYMAADFSTAATTSDTLITDRFTLDTGQRDNYYDISRIIRLPGKAAPTGRLLITYDYYAHGAGNFFSVDSYAGISYGDIPRYTSDVTGESFELRDVLDFRPRVDNASTINAGDGQDRQYSGTGASTIEFAKFNADITADLEFYLSRKAKVYMMSNGRFQILDGESAINPQDPDELKDGMHLYDLFLPAYTFDPKDVVIKKIDNRRYTMRDIGRLENRIENIEYYTQLSLLESEAQNMQIQDSDGLDRFKNGIIVDNFTGHGIGDVSDEDYSVSMDMAQGELRPAYHMDNVKLVERESDLSTAITDTARTTLGYQKTGDLITLPYVTPKYIEQPYASTTVNLNPYDIINFVGNMHLSPDGDEWMETSVRPDFVHHIPGSYDTLTDLASQGVQDLNIGTIWNAWNDSWSGAVQDLNRVVNPSTTSGRIKTTTTTITTTQRVGQNRSGIRTSLVPKEVRTSLGNKVIGTSWVPFIRPQSIQFHASGMKPNTRVYAFFDGVDVNENVTPGLKRLVAYAADGTPETPSESLDEQITATSNAGAALTTDARGSVSGIFTIPTPTPYRGPVPAMVMTNRQWQSFLYRGSKVWRTGRRTFRLTSNPVNSLTGDIFTSAEADYVARGLRNSVQKTIVSTREAQYAKTNLSEDTVINRTGTRTETEEQILEQRLPSANTGNKTDDTNSNITPKYWTHFPNPNDDTSGLDTYTTLASTGEVVLGQSFDDQKSKAKSTPLVYTQFGGGQSLKSAQKTNTEAKPVVKQAVKNSPGPGRAPRNAKAEATARAAYTQRATKTVNKQVSTGNVKWCNGPPWRDPVAQSFRVDTSGGIFISYIDLFFSAKSSNMPVTVQLRTMHNGYPTREVIPFGEVEVAAADINISSDAATATRFSFPSPVYLQQGQEYAFVALANTANCTIYTAKMGQKTIDDARLISKQPMLGSMFKSQNASTWTADQNEDVKFIIGSCSFDVDAIGTVYLVNDEVPALTLTQTNPISTTSGSAVITIHHKNHGMHSTSANVTIAGVPSGTHNGIASTNINGTYTTIGNIKMDSYTVTAQNSDTASATGDIGGTNNVTATRNVLYDVIQPTIANVIHQETSVFASMRTTGGRTLEGDETEYSLDVSTKKKPIALNDDYYMTQPGMIASQINETNEMSGSKSLSVSLSLLTEIGHNNLSPVIDTKTMSVSLIRNRLDNPVSGTTPDFVAETANTGGTAGTKYITKPVILENSSTSLDIRLSANIRATSSVKMYYRVTSAEDVRNLGDVAWTAFNTTGTTDSAVAPAEDDATFKEQQYSASDIPGFTAFQLKIVMTGTNSSYPPLIKDMRGIALAI